VTVTGSEKQGGVYFAVTIDQKHATNITLIAAQFV
jgi:hypothetical protein